MFSFASILEEDDQFLNGVVSFKIPVCLFPTHGLSTELSETCVKCYLKGSYKNISNRSQVSRSKLCND